MQHLNLHSKAKMNISRQCFLVLLVHQLIASIFLDGVLQTMEANYKNILEYTMLHLTTIFQEELPSLAYHRSRVFNLLKALENPYGFQKVLGNPVCFVSIPSCLTRCRHVEAEEMSK